MTIFLTLVFALFGAMLVMNTMYLQRRPRQRPDRLPSVSVIIPARNEAENLARLLPTLFAQEYPRFEVVIYDDHSEDGTWEIISSFEHQHDRTRLNAIRGKDLPDGWVGKVHALFQATREARGDLYLFLDADAELKDSGALERLVERHAGAPERSVVTGLTHLKGEGTLLVSLVPFAILTGIPWPLLPQLDFRSLGALNGQCWMIRSDLYHAHEPHEEHPDEVLEDVVIGRYLKEKGINPYLINVQNEIAIYMYDSLADAWRGFRKNMYLVMGGGLVRAVLFFFFFGLIYLAAPYISLWYLGGLYLMKFWTDRIARFSPLVSLLMPLSFVLGTLLQIDSALHHLFGRASWKGRIVGRS